MKATLQKRNVVALGEHKVSEHPFVVALREHPLVNLQWVDHTKRPEVQQADIIVHFGPEASEIQKFSLQKPTLFICDNPQLVMIPSESLWKEYLSLDASMDDFQNTLGRLFELVTLQKHRDELLRREHLHDRYIGNLDLTRIASVVGRVIQLVGESTRAKNVCWISGEVAQTWWTETNRRKTNLSFEAMADLAHSVWWKPETADLDYLMKQCWPLAGIGRDWQSGEMVADWDKKCGVMRLVVEGCEFDLGYILIDEPQRNLRSGRFSK